MSANRSYRQQYQRKRASPAVPSQPSSGLAMNPACRLQKLLAQSGLGSRREMEGIIAAGRTSINGVTAKLGDRVCPEDMVRVDGKIVRFRLDKRLPRVIIYHKPEGEIVSMQDPRGRPSVFDKLPRMKSSRWISIGRLDFNTSGLLIFTTDGILANRLMHPRFQMEREYVVRIVGQLNVEQITTLTTGIKLDDGLAKFDQLTDEGGLGTNHWYRVTLKEGRNREVRRMFEALGLTVSRLMRVRFGPISLSSRLKRGMWLELTDPEIGRLLELIK